MRDPVDLDSFEAAASRFWSHQLQPAGDRVILVEAMTQDLRVSVRNLSVANALRRIEPARVVVFYGADEDWNRVVWSYYDPELLRQLASGMAADEFFDIHQLVDARVAGRVPDVRIAGVDLGADLPESGISPARMDQIVDATTCRMELIPRLTDSAEHQRHRAEVARRSREFSRVYDALFANNRVTALVSSHVDYSNFGLAVESSLRHGVPVYFPQSTGGLKSYVLRPESLAEGEPVRAGLTREIGEWFESHVWANREVLRSGAELTTARSKLTLGRPSWWRGGTVHSGITTRDGDRAVMRAVGARRTGLDVSKPVVVVFNHAVSDALGTNHEAFSDLAAWFEATAAYAAEHPEVSWLFLDHPQQHLYDVTDFFDGVAEQYAEHRHMSFLPSMELSKNILIAMADLVLTVRGSVSNEYPAYGVPAIQSGWSEWSHCGFTTVADTPEEYVEALEKHLAGLLSGTPLITDEQIERARLWTWFYRIGSDVVTSLVPAWQFGDTQGTFHVLTMMLRESEVDGDPLFVSMRRMLQRDDPFLSRFDLIGSAEQIADRIAPIEMD